MKFMAPRKESRIDGRFLVLAVLIAYFCVIFFGSSFGHYVETWKRFGVPAMDSLFGDLSQVLNEFDLIRSGDNTAISNPRGFVGYPRIWRSLTGLGLGKSNTLPLGVLSVIAFYVSTFFLIGRLNYREGIFYSLVLCSPPVMLLVERGNVDIIIYSLLFLAIIFIKKRERPIIRVLGYLAILVTAFFKLFPIFGLSVVIKERRKGSILIGGALFGLFLVYIFSHLQEIHSIEHFHGKKDDWYRFGYKNILYRFNAFQTEPTLIHSKKRILFTLLLFLSLVFSGKAFIDLWKKAKHWVGQRNLEPFLNSLPNNAHIDAFRLGASIYIGIFLIIGRATDFKLAFLIFTMPQILSWVKDGGPMSFSSGFALLGILGTLYLSQFQAWAIDEIINWLLLGYFIYGFCRSLPEWIIKGIHSALSFKRG